MEDRGVEPTSVTHNMVIEGLIVADKLDEAEAFYERLEHKSRENDASMVKGYCEAGCLDQAFERFISLECPLPKSVYFTLFTSLCAENDYISKAQELLERMWELGVEPEKSMYGKLIGAWCRVNNLKEAYALFIRMKTMGIKPDVVTCTVLLNIPKFDTKREMKAFDVKPDVVYYTFLIAQQCKIQDLQEAERIFAEMIESGLEPDVVPYTALIASCCRNGFVHKAVTLIQEMWGKGIEPTTASLSTVQYAILKAKRLRSKKVIQEFMKRAYI
ncbi:putative tetratricopeptide-like helical domain superfamily [Arabidopsis thaliana]